MLFPTMSFAPEGLDPALGHGLAMMVGILPGVLLPSPRRSPVGWMLMRVLPGLLVLALGLEALEDRSVRLGLVQPREGAMLLSSCYLLMLAGLALRNARQLCRAEEERLRSEDRFRTIFEQAPMGIALLDSLTGRILEVNAKYVELVGRTREAITSLDWMGLTHPEDVQEDLDQMARLNAGAISGFQMDKRLLRPDGSVVWVRLAVVPVQVEANRRRCHLAMLEDHTGRRKLEEERERLNRHLVQAQQLDSLGCLAGGVAHDMNNVLGIILGVAAANLEAQAPGSPGRQTLETIIQAAERGGRTVQSLLSFARHAPVEERDLNLNELLLEEAELLERTTLFKVRLERDLAADLRPVLGDAGALANAFMNLCVNALDAMPAGGILTLRTRNVAPALVEVQIADTGTGMASEVLVRCLEPFFTTKEVGKGTGLGLALVYSAVKAHHGQLDLESQAGKGTCVRMRFPASAPPPQADAAPPRPGPCPRVLQVLVIEDDQLFQGAVQALLKSLGHTAVLAGSGEQALALVKAGLAPDLVVLDMNMPGLGGNGTLPGLGSLRPRLPVILATGRVDQAALDLMASDPLTLLLPKPFGLQELKARIAEAWGKRAGLFGC